MGEGLRFCCKSYLVMLNTVILLAGLAVTGFAIYLLVEGNNNGVFDAFSSWVAWLPLAIGVSVSLLALVGCCISTEGRSCFLYFYGILEFIFGVVILIAGVALVVYIGYQKTISTTNYLSSLSSGIGGTQHYLSDFNYGLYENCCLGSTSTPTTKCESGTNTAICYWNIDSFNAGNNADCQPITENLDICSQSSSLTSFNVQLYDYYQQYFFPGGIAFIVFGSLLLLASFGSCYVVCSKPRPTTQQPQPKPQQYQSRPGAPAQLV